MTVAAIYVRISQETAETTSPARQRDACAKLVADRGWDLTEVYEDLDLSAYSGAPRPAFDRLMADLDRFDVVVVWKLDRLYRRFVGFVDVLGRLEAASVELVSATESLDTTSPMGKGIAGVLAAQAEQESANTSVRVRSAQQHLARTGRWRGGRVPFGWQAVDHPDGGRALAVDPDQAQLVREAVRRVLSGESGLGVAEDLNRRGIPSPTGSRWHSKTILSILRSPRLVGHRIHQGRPVVDDDGVPLVLDPPLIDRPTWEALQRALTGRDRRRHPVRQRATLLSGVVRCGRCGGRMVGWTARRPDAAYACSVRAESGTTVCPGNAIARIKTDDLVVAALLAYLTPEALAQTRELIRERAAVSVDPAGRRAAELKDAIDRLETDRVELGLYDDPEGRARYADRMRRLTRELGELRSRAPGQPTILDAVGDSTDPAGEWEGWSDARKRTVVRAAIDRVVIGPLEGPKKWDPDRVSIVWRRQQ
jgi:site-specific DNA recombinase